MRSFGLETESSLIQSEVTFLGDIVLIARQEDSIWEVVCLCCSPLALRGWTDTANWVLLSIFKLMNGAEWKKDGRDESGRSGEAVGVQREGVREPANSSYKRGL